MINFRNKVYFTLKRNIFNLSKAMFKDLTSLFYSQKTCLYYFFIYYFNVLLKTALMFFCKTSKIYDNVICFRLQCLALYRTPDCCGSAQKHLAKREHEGVYILIRLSQTRQLIKLCDYTLESYKKKDYNTLS